MVIIIHRDQNDDIVINIYQIGFRNPQAELKLSFASDQGKTKAVYTEAPEIQDVQG